MQKMTMESRLRGDRLSFSRWKFHKNSHISDFSDFEIIFTEVIFVFWLQLQPRQYICLKKSIFLKFSPN